MITPPPPQEPLPPPPPPKPPSASPIPPPTMPLAQDSAAVVPPLPSTAPSPKKPAPPEPQEDEETIPPNPSSTALTVQAEVSSEPEPITPKVVSDASQPFCNTLSRVPPPPPATSRGSSAGSTTKLPPPPPPLQLTSNPTCPTATCSTVPAFRVNSACRLAPSPPTTEGSAAVPWAPTAVTRYRPDAGTVQLWIPPETVTSPARPVPV